MQKARQGLMVAAMLVCVAATAGADVSVSIGLPNVSIGINLPRFPEMTPVPGYPVYYAPRVDGNYFFYDGMYWVYENDNWFASTWYNGPWAMVFPDDVPLFVLRIPVRYYRQPPVYFRGWHQSAPPRWGQRWGHEWEYNRRGWDRWKHGSAPAAAPLPVYQRQYSGDRYPSREYQQPLRNQHYRYQPRDTTVRKQIEQQERRHVEPRHQSGPPDSRPQQQQPQQRGPSYQEQRQQEQRQQEQRQQEQRQQEQRQQHPAAQPEHKQVRPQEQGHGGRDGRDHRDGREQDQRQQDRHGRGNDKDDDRRPGR